jgi:hypothetical protein
MYIHAAATDKGDRPAKSLIPVVCSASSRATFSILAVFLNRSMLQYRSQSEAAEVEPLLAS